jgi:ABC-type uncharacterized transport system permease subunit
MRASQSAGVVNMGMEGNMMIVQRAARNIGLESLLVDERHVQPGYQKDLPTSILMGKKT